MLRSCQEKNTMNNQIRNKQPKSCLINFLQEGTQQSFIRKDWTARSSPALLFFFLFGFYFVLNGNGNPFRVTSMDIIIIGSTLMGLKNGSLKFDFLYDGLIQWELS